MIVAPWSGWDPVVTVHRSARVRGLGLRVGNRRRGRSTDHICGGKIGDEQLRGE
jgi:hypothetical protein